MPPSRAAHAGSATATGAGRRAPAPIGLRGPANPSPAGTRGWAPACARPSPHGLAPRALAQAARKRAQAAATSRRGALHPPSERLGEPAGRRDPVPPVQGAARRGRQQWRRARPPARRPLAKDRHQRRPTPALGRGSRSPSRGRAARHAVRRAACGRAVRVPAPDGRQPRRRSRPSRALARRLHGQPAPISVGGGRRTAHRSGAATMRRARTTTRAFPSHRAGSRIPSRRAHPQRLRLRRRYQQVAVKIRPLRWVRIQPGRDRRPL